MPNIKYMEKGGLEVEPRGENFRVVDADTRKTIADKFTMLYEAEEFILEKLGLTRILRNLKYWEAC